MKKVLVVFDGESLPSSSLDFALALNGESPILLTGVFLPAAEAENFTFYGTPVPSYNVDEYNDTKNLIKKNIGNFKNYCERNNIHFKIREEIGSNVVNALRDQSRFADLMILSNSNFYNDPGEVDKGEYMKGILHKSECPVIVLPEGYKIPDSIVLSYDGSASSMFAIKQFVYLLPHLTELETHLVFLGDHKHEIPFLDLIKEYAPQHFTKIEFSNIQIELSPYLYTRKDKKETVMLVAGALGRNEISEFIHNTFIKKVISEGEIPIFIAHK